MNFRGKISLATVTLALVGFTLALLNALGVTDIDWDDFYWMTFGVLVGLFTLLYTDAQGRFGLHASGWMLFGMCVWNLVGGLTSQADGQGTSESEVGDCVELR